MRITISKENYLKAIAEAESEGETVIAATLARWLGVSAPAVTMATKRLKRDALIEAAKDGRITLTAPGREIANRLIYRHYLIERMLTEVFGMEWYKVHEEAEALEHAVSPTSNAASSINSAAPPPIAPTATGSALTPPPTGGLAASVPSTKPTPATLASSASTNATANSSNTSTNSESAPARTSV